jgi:hypothetical protein
MKRILLFLPILVAAALTGEAQDTIVPHSRYRTIRVIDDRSDTTRGASPAVFQQYFDALMEELTDSTAARNELLLQMRDFHVYGFQRSSTNRGGTWIRLVLYARPEGEDKRYGLLAVLDTAIETRTNLFKGPLHKRVLSATDEAVTRFVAANLTRAPDTGRRYSLEAIHAIENLTKLELPVYSAATLKDGVYRSYHSFAWQEPDGDMSTFDANRTYAVVQNGNPSIFVASNPLPLVRKENDFYYIGRISAYSATTSEFASLSWMAAAAALSGGLHVLTLWRVWVKKDFWMKMDPLSGHFAAMRQVKKEEMP